MLLCGEILLWKSVNINKAGRAGEVPALMFPVSTLCPRKFLELVFCVHLYYGIQGNRKNRFRYTEQTVG
ncbi:MAG: hypothetical protein J6T29_00520 [Alphaproteobacteria bacterium]|nr:hypothetical protein [Alphaproteobacteria bacterium]